MREESQPGLFTFFDALKMNSSGYRDLQPDEF
jgi:hypothetical protein